MRGLQLLYEGRDVQVFGRRDGRTAGVTFSPLPRNGTPEVFGDTLLLKAGMTAVHFVAKRSHWWHSPERRAATKAARSFLRDCPERVTFGLSMGGYGALSWARDVGATRIIAVAPQTTLRGPLLPEWEAALSQVHIERDALADDVPDQAAAVLIYDPLCEVDRFHADWLAAKRPVARVEASGLGHGILKGLRTRGVGTWEMVALLKDEMSAGEMQARIDVGTLAPALAQIDRGAHSCVTAGAVGPV